MKDVSQMESMNLIRIDITASRAVFRNRFAEVSIEIDATLVTIRDVAPVPELGEMRHGWGLHPARIAEAYPEPARCPYGYIVHVGMRMEEFGSVLQSLSPRSIEVPDGL